ncbi:MAG: hypothetical protein IPG85_07710 [Bacteroidetes bacterium]|nr:hypothetical protein [Bacteroidota bacterium]
MFNPCRWAYNFAYCTENAEGAITENVIAKNQMTSVAIGAALYASTKEIGVVAPPPPVGTIALDLKYDAAVVGEEVRVQM